MFSNLTDFSAQRSTAQAIGFYIAYLLLALVSAFLVGLIIGSIMGKGDDFNYGVKIGVIYATLYVLLAKKLSNNFSYLLLLILSGILGYFGGGLLGLIPTAYLTTRPVMGAVKTSKTTKKRR
jgi:hypothetical protein